jgi:iron complex outermembrane receptor protein
VSLTGDVTLPLNESIGEITLGAIFTYTSSQFVDGYTPIPGYSLLNLNAAWNNVGGSGISVIGFATNITNKDYRTTSGGGFDAYGIRDFAYGPPRMYGVRVKYSFGQ